MKLKRLFCLLGISTSILCVVNPDKGAAQSLNFVANKPVEYDFVDIPKVPKGFGEGEFALEMWLKPDATYPVGGVFRGSFDQLNHWSDADPEPYSSEGWWLSGNWLIDGHTRPEGFLSGHTREGTLSLQFYGGGRLRFMFSDAKAGMPKGMVYAVQAWPATKTPSLLDNQWHHVVALRRWKEPQGAILELWIDGHLIEAVDIPRRTNMRKFWDHLAHPGDPIALGGWSLGSEVMTAWDYALTQYEDYKGLVDNLRFWGRAPNAKEIAGWARHVTKNQTLLLADYRFNEGGGARIYDRIDQSASLTLFRGRPNSWSLENAGPTP